jgi:hypothetical protein
MPTPLPSRIPGSRQHILGVTPGFGFLSHPSQWRHYGWLPAPCMQESLGWVTPFHVPILRGCREVLYAGFHASGCWT